MPYSPIYNDASLGALDELLSEYNAAETTDERREQLEPLLIGLSEQKDIRLLELRQSYVNLEQEIAGLEPMLKRLSERKLIASKKMATAERIAAFLAGEGNKISLPDGGSIGWRSSQAVIVTDEAALPEEFVKVVRSPDKVVISKHLKSGAECSGAYLEKRNNIQIK